MQEREGSMVKKVPWGIISGLIAMVVFFSTFGFIASYLILNGIASATHSTVGLFDMWYQKTLFIVDIISVIGLAGTFTMYILGHKKPQEATK